MMGAHAITHSPTAAAVAALLLLLLVLLSFPAIERSVLVAASMLAFGVGCSSDGRTTAADR
jgi:hypothetical protein